MLFYSQLKDDDIKYIHDTIRDTFPTIYTILSNLYCNLDSLGCIIDTKISNYLKRLRNFKEDNMLLMGATDTKKFVL
jgi:hypothetical protein